MQRKSLLIQGMWGLGDNIYSRPFIRAATAKYDIHLETPWPELYADLNIKFVAGNRRLRTQLKNMARQSPTLWSAPPITARRIRIGYADLAVRSIIASKERQWSTLGVGFDPQLFDLPEMGPSPIVTEWPIAVVRPVTVRKEWRNEARNPRPEYLAEIAAALMPTHRVVAVADIAAEHEWPLGELPPAHDHFLNGELSVRQLLALIRHADIVIGGVGWIVPAGLALKVKTFVLLGGQGGHNAPEKITDPRLDLRRIGFAIPDKFCQCCNMLHNCDKRIAEPLSQFSRWSRNLQVVV